MWLCHFELQDYAYHQFFHQRIDNHISRATALIIRPKPQTAATGSKFLSFEVNINSSRTIKIGDTKNTWNYFKNNANGDERHF